MFQIVHCFQRLGKIDLLHTTDQVLDVGLGQFWAEPMSQDKKRCRPYCDSISAFRNQGAIYIGHLRKQILKSEGSSVKEGTKKICF